MKTLDLRGSIFEIFSGVSPERKWRHMVCVLERSAAALAVGHLKASFLKEAVGGHHVQRRKPHRLDEPAAFSYGSFSDQPDFGQA